MKNLKETIKTLCKLYNISPSKSKGQNFLINESVYREVIRHANLTKDDTVLEVGPGFGTLTELLARSAKRVIAVELDKKLVEILRAQLVSYKNIEIIHGDILHMSLRGTERSEATRQSHGSGGLPQSPPAGGSFAMTIESDYKIVANLPYNITSHFIRKFLTLPFPPHPTLSPEGRGDVAGHSFHGREKYSNSLPRPNGERGVGEGEVEFNLSKPSLMVLMLQKEVAERICAKPKDMSMLSFSVQWYAQPQILAEVPRKDFWPEPKVDSAIIKITPYPKEKINALLESAQVDEKMLFRVVKWGFASKRKQLHNNISNGLYAMIQRKVDIHEIQDILEQCKVHPRVRAQELSIQDWLNLASRLYKDFKV